MRSLDWAAVSSSAPAEFFSIILKARIPPTATMCNTNTMPNTRASFTFGTSVCQSCSSVTCADTLWGFAHNVFSNLFVFRLLVLFSFFFSFMVTVFWL